MRSTDQKLSEAIWRRYYLIIQIVNLSVIEYGSLAGNGQVHAMADWKEAIVMYTVI